MKFRNRPQCYHMCGKPARLPKSHFCSDKCASEWAEVMREGNEDDYCFLCQEWANVHNHNSKCPGKFYQDIKENQNEENYNLR